MTRTMSRQDFSSYRLFVEAPLAAGELLALNREQSNYLLNVLRLGAGARVLVFNGRDGEWRARLEAAGKRDASLRLEERAREQTPAGDLRSAVAGSTRSSVSSKR